MYRLDNYNNFNDGNVVNINRNVVPKMKVNKSLFSGMRGNGLFLMREHFNDSNDDNTNDDNDNDNDNDDNNNDSNGVDNMAETTTVNAIDNTYDNASYNYQNENIDIPYELEVPEYEHENEENENGEDLLVESSFSGDVKRVGVNALEKIKQMFKK